MGFVTTQCAASVVVLLVVMSVITWSAVHLGMRVSNEQNVQSQRKSKQCIPDIDLGQLCKTKKNSTTTPTRTTLPTPDLVKKSTIRFPLPGITKSVAEEVTFSPNESSTISNLNSDPTENYNETTIIANETAIFNFTRTPSKNQLIPLIVKSYTILKPISNNSLNITNNGTLENIMETTTVKYTTTEEDKFENMYNVEYGNPDVSVGVNNNTTDIWDILTESTLKVYDTNNSTTNGSKRSYITGRRSLKMANNQVPNNLPKETISTKAWIDTLNPIIQRPLLSIRSKTSSNTPSMPVTRKPITTMNPTAGKNYTLNVQPFHFPLIIPLPDVHTREQKIGWHTAASNYTNI